MEIAKFDQQDMRALRHDGKLLLVVNGNRGYSPIIADAKSFAIDKSTIKYNPDLHILLGGIAAKVEKDDENPDEVDIEGEVSLAA